MIPKILIIDDDIRIRTLLHRFLQRRGFDTMLAEDGLEGIEMAKKSHPDLIILDVVMPRMDGLTAGRLIKHYKPLSKVPIVYLTAACGEKEIALAREAEADVYVTKPFDLHRIHAILTELLVGHIPN